MSDKLRKILLISSYAPPAIGGPQMLYNLFQDFTPSSYSILTSYYNIDDISARKGTWLPGEYIFYDNPTASKEARKSVSGNIPVQKLKFTMKRIRLVRILAGFPVILSQIFAIVWVGRKVIKKNNSEILLGVSDYGPAMIGSYILHKLTRIPLYLLLLDLYEENFFPFPGGLLAKMFERKIFKSAKKIIVNNEGTKTHYLKKYGDIVSEKISIIHNSVSPEDNKGSWPGQNADSRNLPYVILFTGRVNWPQLGALRNLIQAVNETQDVDIIFKLYSPSPKEYLNGVGITESEKVKVAFAPPQDIAKIQKEADILFLPLSWGTKSPAIIDTATPAKLTDYLIAGKPMLIHAPSSSFLVKYAKDNNFALVVDENSIEKLKVGIKTLLADKENAKELVRNAERTFFLNHDLQKNILLFKSIFKY